MKGKLQQIVKVSILPEPEQREKKRKLSGSEEDLDREQGRN